MNVYYSTNNEQIFEWNSTPYLPAFTSTSPGYAQRNLLNYSNANVGPRRTIKYKVINDPVVLDITNVPRQDLLQKMQDYYENKMIDFRVIKPPFSRKRTFVNLFLNQGSKKQTFVEEPLLLDTIFYIGGKEASALVAKYFYDQGIDVVKEGNIFTFLTPQDKLELVSIDPQDNLYMATLDLFSKVPVEEIMRKYKIGDKNQLMMVYQLNKKNPPKVEWLKQRIQSL
jgi:hypothetical protein